MRKELLRCRSHWTLLSKLTGKKLSYRWLIGFANGEIKDPAASKLETLGKYIGMKVTLKPTRHFLKFEPE